MPARRKKTSTKLTPEIEEKILALVAEGNYLSTAARAAGIASSTYRLWKQKGRDGKQPYADFFARADQAEAKGETAMVALLKFASLGYRKVRDPNDPKATITEEFKGDPKPIEWLMQRRLGQRWGDRLKVEFETAVGDMLTTLKGRLDPLAFKAVVEALEDREDRSPDAGDGDGLAAEFGELLDEAD